MICLPLGNGTYHSFGLTFDFPIWCQLNHKKTKANKPKHPTTPAPKPKPTLITGKWQMLIEKIYLLLTMVQESSFITLSQLYYHMKWKIHAYIYCL